MPAGDFTLRACRRRGCSGQPLLRLPAAERQSGIPKDIRPVSPKLVSQMKAERA